MLIPIKQKVEFTSTILDGNLSPHAADLGFHKNESLDSLMADPCGWPSIVVLPKMVIFETLLA